MRWRSACACVGFVFLLGCGSGKVKIKAEKVDLTEAEQQKRKDEEEAHIKAAEAEATRQQQLAAGRRRYVLANTWLFMPRADDPAVNKAGRANRLMAFAADGLILLGRSPTEHRIAFENGLLEISSEDGAAWMRFAPETGRFDCNWHCDRKANQPVQHPYSARLVLVKNDVPKLRARLKLALKAQTDLETGLAQTNERVATLSGAIQEVEEDIGRLRVKPLPITNTPAAQNNVRKKRQADLDALDGERTQLTATQEQCRALVSRLGRALEECKRSVNDALAPFRAMDIDIQQVLDKD